MEIEFVSFETAATPLPSPRPSLAGEAGDILHVRAYGAFETVAAPGFLLPLDDKVPELADFPPLSVAGETLRSDGRVYAVPFASQTLVIYYNTDIFDRPRLEPPRRPGMSSSPPPRRSSDAGIIPIANGTATGWMNEVFTGVFAPNFYGAGFFDEIIAGDTDFTDERYVGALERCSSCVPTWPPTSPG